MELILVRHAEPVAAHTASGFPADPPLSERGQQQAIDVATWLTRRPVDRVVSSPALRARETAEATARLEGLAGLAGPGVQVEVDERLRDAHPEADHYVPLELDKARDPEAYQARVREYLDSPRLAEIATRVVESLDEWSAQCAGKRVAVFCHGSVVNVFAARVLGLGQGAFLEADYASAHRFMISRSGVRSVRSLNETAYLASDSLRLG